MTLQSQYFRTFDANMNIQKFENSKILVTGPDGAVSPKN